MTISNFLDCYFTLQISTTDINILSTNSCRIFKQPGRFIISIIIIVSYEDHYDKIIQRVNFIFFQIIHNLIRPQLTHP